MIESKEMRKALKLLEQAKKRMFTSNPIIYRRSMQTTSNCCYFWIFYCLKR